MEAKLVRERNNMYYFDKDGEHCEGQNPWMSGNCSGLRGNLDACQLNDNERAAKVNIADLVVKE